MNPFEDERAGIYGTSETPWSTQDLTEFIATFEGERLEGIKNGNHACEEIRQYCQTWKIPISDFTIIRYGAKLWRKAQQWTDHQNTIRQNRGQYRYAVSDNDNPREAWQKYSKERIGYPAKNNGEVNAKERKPVAPKPPNPANTPLAQSAVKTINKELTTVRGYVYFKEWNLNGHLWYKIGVTNNPKRRDSEQNVLPVAPKTLALLRVSSIEVAKEIEKSLHKLLESERVKGAQNREIFELKEGQAESIQAALKSFER